MRYFFILGALLPSLAAAKDCAYFWSAGDAVGIENAMRFTVKSCKDDIGGNADNLFERAAVNGAAPNFCTVCRNVRRVTYDYDKNDNKGNKYSLRCGYYKKFSCSQS
ncbi:uncharacterized protein CTRU02_214460 [Colletotrichum truncatum]|uniref:Uncharacterized protein n=1 Tax=Colletotrichum truncatum TaxID=5467 RepID=A0ACC3YEY2_COLTU|nr:uncharacterized protein CTRU02_12130 [Colletotrichum truncatum]KAF6784919.1 hypothetical protein CTRU02_12130 [Colletotrichum truncatum]